jgi:hypothetical protein
MQVLGYVYRVVSNFAFLALVYYSLNFMEKYHQRATIAILVLIYAGMRAASALRSFYFYSDWNSRRGVSWACSETGLPPRPPESRSSPTSARCAIPAR